MDQQKELKKAGLKVTHPRVTVLKLLEEAGNKHYSAEDMYRILVEEGKDFGLATVYRVLNQFEDAGIVDRHHFEAGKSVFEISDKHHHDHLICLSCGRIVEFEDDVIEQRQEEIAKERGLKLTHHSLYLYGFCKDECQES